MCYFSLFPAHWAYLFKGIPPTSRALPYSKPHLPSLLSLLNLPYSLLLPQQSCLSTCLLYNPKYLLRYILENFFGLVVVWGRDVYPIPRCSLICELNFNIFLLVSSIPGPYQSFLYYLNSVWLWNGYLKFCIYSYSWNLNVVLHYLLKNG
ncbi:149aa long hypothetical protein [Pyrococcus horikoshii OT3]|uniref:Uncharacterized protein n=1 Tax=Pyrococcus horikoshii (strain ATCC 700860 / DSM 12428 / JCM 9974 / NBRC 100139 / OT-3) TaxID=70601 RepID=O58656_PYRHO|nr:149aa long hypothetical protein [Pyrococcus horikoshii OT3]